MRKYNFNMEKCPRYGLRKYLGLGLCAVTLGTFFMTSGQTVKADQVSASTNDAQVVEVQKEQPQNNKGQPEAASTPVEDTSATPTQDTPVAKSASETSKPQVAPTGGTATDTNKDAENAPESETPQGNQSSTNETGAHQENGQQPATPTKIKQTKEADAQTPQPVKAPTAPVKKTAPTKSDENVQKKVNVIYVDASSKVDPNTFFKDDLYDMTDYSSLPEMSRKEVTENIVKIDSDIASFTDKTTQREQSNVLDQDVLQYDVGRIPKNWVHAFTDRGTYAYSYKVSETTENGLTTRINDIYVPVIHEIKRDWYEGAVRASTGRIRIKYPSEKYGTDNLAFISGVFMGTDNGTETDMVTGKTIHTPMTAKWRFFSLDDPRSYSTEGNLIEENGNASFGQKIVLPLYIFNKSTKDVYDMHLTFKSTQFAKALNLQYDSDAQTLTIAIKKGYSIRDLWENQVTSFDGVLTFTPKKFTNDVEFVDDTTGQKLPQFTYHMPETEVDKTATLTGLSIPENYELATGQTLPTSYNFDSQLINGKWEVSTTPVVIHLVHAKQDLGTDTKTITRTIETINPDGSKADEDQTVTFTRDKAKDKVTGNIIYGSWNKPNGTLSEKDVVQIDGYKSLVDGTAAVKVLAETVTPESNNSKVVVTYQKINNTTPDKKDDPTTPSKGEDDPTPPAPEPEPTNNDNTTPLPEQEPTSDVNNDQNNATVAPKDEKAPVKSEAAPIKNVHKVNGPVKTEQNIVKTPAKTTKFTGRVVKTDVKVAPAKQTATLPQTGEKEDIAIASLGLTMATIGLLGLKKKKYLHDAN